MTVDERNQATATLHCAIDRVLGEAARQLHAAVQADVNAQALAEHWKGVADRQRIEIEGLKVLRQADWDKLTDIRRALGALEDADLVEEASGLRISSFSSGPSAKWSWHGASLVVCRRSRNPARNTISVSACPGRWLRRSGSGWSVCCYW